MIETVTGTVTEIEIAGRFATVMTIADLIGDDFDRVTDR